MADSPKKTAPESGSAAAAKKSTVKKAGASRSTTGSAAGKKSSAGKQPRKTASAKSAIKKKGSAAAGKSRTKAGTKPVAPKASAAAAPPAAPSASPKQTPAEGSAKSLLSEAAEHIEGGARVVGEKATAVAETLISKIKEGVSSAYRSGARLVDELAQSAQGYMDKFKNEAEMKKLRGQRDELATQLGRSFFNQYRAAGSVTKDILKSEEIAGLISRIEQLDEEIISLGKRLQSQKNP